MIHIPFVVLTGSTVISVVLGRLVHDLVRRRFLVRERFLAERALERRRAERAEHASWLEREGLGLDGRRDRAAELDGTLELDSADGEGTRVRMRFPRARLREVTS